MNAESPRPSPAARLFDLVGIAGLFFALPTAFHVCGQGSAARFFEESLGPLGSPPALLLAFLALTLLRMLFGSSKRALPVFSGLLVGLLCFAATFDFPYLGPVRAAASRFPAFGEPGPAFFAGLASIVLGSLLGQRPGGQALVKFLLPPASALSVLLLLAGLRPFPPVERDGLSMDRAFSEIARALGTEYRNPEVDAAVKRVVEDGRKTLAEKESEIAALTGRLQRAEDDRAALARSSADAKAQGDELDAARKALAELKGKLDRNDPVLPGGSYDRAVQPMDPGVRDFAVGIAKKYPGAFDEPQGSRRPVEAGLRQVLLLHSAISSSWKYVSDPGLSWSEYVSPAKRTLAIGLAGDCDDFATMV
ncbi:MAG: hypothetical protein WCL50_16450, partial [Spirochaetota bacterium]